MEEGWERRASWRGGGERKYSLCPYRKGGANRCPKRQRTAMSLDWGGSPFPGPRMQHETLPSLSPVWLFVTLGRTPLHLAMHDARWGAVQVGCAGKGWGQNGSPHQPGSRSSTATGQEGESGFPASERGCVGEEGPIHCPSSRAPNEGHLDHENGAVADQAEHRRRPSSRPRAFYIRRAGRRGTAAGVVLLRALSVLEAKWGPLEPRRCEQRVVWRVRCQ